MEQRSIIIRPYYRWKARWWIELTNISSLDSNNGRCSQHGHEKETDRGRGGIGFAGWAPQGVWFTAVILGSLPANYTQSDVRWCTTKKITNSRPPASWWVFSIKEKHKAVDGWDEGRRKAPAAESLWKNIARAHKPKRKSHGASRLHDK